MSKSYVGAYWGPRSASVDDCANRLAHLVTELATISPLLTGWRALGKSKRQAVAQPLVTTYHADLVTRLLEGRNRRDDNDEVIDDLGYSIQWWNGATDDAAAANLRLACGASAPRTSNAALVRLPHPDVADDLYTAERAGGLLRALIINWDPDWAVWTNHDLVDEQTGPPEEFDGGGYVPGDLVGHQAGWANYVSDRDSVRFEHALLPPTAAVEQIGNGTLVTLGDHPADPPLRDVLAVRAAMGCPAALPDRQLDRFL